MFRKGTPIVVVGATFGWGDVREGDKGVVIQVETLGKETKGSYIVFIAGKGSWQAGEKDVIIDTNSGSASGVKERAAFVEPYMQFCRNSKGLVLKKVADLESLQDKMATELDTIDNALAFWRKKAATRLLYPEDPTALEGVYQFVQYLYNLYEIIEFIGEPSCLLLARTKPITLHWNKFSIPMGRYEVKLGDNIIGITAIDGITTEDGYCHPHIGSSICWGSWKSAINKALLGYDYLSLLYEIGNFLNQYSEVGWFRHVMAFAKDKDKRCNKCFELLEVCKCAKIVCVHCGEVLGEGCKCKICPASGEVIGKEWDTYCKTLCESWDKKGERCKDATESSTT